MTSRAFSLTALSLSILLAGCATSSDYAAQMRPLKVPAEYGHGQDTAAVGQPALVALSAPEAMGSEESLGVPWWHGYKDARLTRLVDQVLAANADLAAAGFTLRRARAEAGLAADDLLPQAVSGMESSVTRPLKQGSSSVRSHRIHAGLSWEADLFGKLAAQRDVLAWQAEASAEDLRATALQLAGDACRHFWTIAFLNQAIRAGEADLVALERIVRLVEIQHAAGEVSGLEPREVKQRLQSQRAAQSALLQQRVEVRNALTILLDGNPWPQSDEPQSLHEFSLPQLRAGMPAELLSRRPDLRAAERRLRASLANIDATVRSFYPSISLTGSLSGGGVVLSDVMREPTGMLGVSLSLPFLNVERMQLNTEAAGASYLQAASEFRRRLHSALHEVDTALSARERLFEQSSAHQRSYRAAAEIARMYEIRYREGASALRTWLDAQRDLRSSELALAQVQRDQAHNDVMVRMALGGA